ncbi:hypothetical protein HY483_02815 [Candidatus Woesearchaeota archaeon]|nr:hypothetical protein [Candidatus Woesearchaeota archaeon]
MKLPLNVLAEAKISGRQNIVPAGLVADSYALIYMLDPEKQSVKEYFSLVIINEPSRGGVVHYTIINAPSRASDSVDPGSHLDGVLKMIFETGALQLSKTGEQYVLRAESREDRINVLQGYLQGYIKAAKNGSGLK